jgi:hypothetical protein
MRRYVTPEALAVPEVAAGETFPRADLVFLGVDHSGPSYEARVFFNSADADISTPTDADHGYAGSFNVFGHGACYGEEGHCDPKREYRDAFDVRLPHPLEPIAVTVVVTEALARVASEELTVTVVAAEHRGERAEASDALAFDELRLLMYEP